MSATKPEETNSETPGVSLETLQQFTDSFGDNARSYLLSGLSFDQANLKYKDERIAALEAENKTLKDQAFAITESAREADELVKYLRGKLQGEATPIEMQATGKI